MRAGRAYALVLAVALAATAASLTNGFVADDIPVIEQDSRIHSLAGLPRLFIAPYWAQSPEENNYRPVTTVVFALVWAAGGGRPLAFHLTNVIVNLAVVALVLALALRVLSPAGAVVPALERNPAGGAKAASAAGAGSAGAVVTGLERDPAGGAKDGSAAKAGSAGAVVAALWFAVQPVHVEAVAYSVGLAELLTATGYLAALLAYVADGDAADAGLRSSWRRAALAFTVLAGSAVAFGAKESGITLPAMLLLADLWRARGEVREGGAWQRFRRHAPLWIGVVALAAATLVGRYVALGPLFSGGTVAIGLEGRSPLDRALVMAPAVLVWLRWFLWPVHLSADYLPNQFVPSASLGAPQLAGFAVLALLALGAWRARRTMPAVTVGLVFAAVAGSLAANVVVPTGVILAERLAYLPSVGLALVAGALWARMPRGAYLWPATALVLALLAARTIRRIPVWRDVGHLVQGLRRDAPNSCTTHWSVGRVAFAQGERGLGEAELRRAIAICPEIERPVEDLGRAYFEAGLFLPADRYLTAAYRLDTLESRALVLAILARVRDGRADSALALAVEAVRRFPDSAEVLGSAEQAYLLAGRPRQALALARRVVFLDSQSWRYQQVAAYAAALNGHCEEARSRLQRAAGLAPDQTGVRDQLRRWHTGAGCGIAAKGAAPRQAR